MKRITRLSYLVFILTFIIVDVFALATPLLTVLFSCLILFKLRIFKQRWIAVFIFGLLVLFLFYSFAFFARQAIKDLPEAISKSLPLVVSYAKGYDIDLPFADFEGPDGEANLRSFLVQGATERLDELMKFARIATKEFVFLLIGLVIAVNLFLHSTKRPITKNLADTHNFYDAITEEVTRRFASFYNSFALVIGAQLVISIINTSFTAIYVVLSGLPYPTVIIGITFLCGLLPIIGNIISNTIIIAIAITVSPKLAFASLIFLIVIHKLEYFLNSKIIGDRIKIPMWLTLFGLVIGESVMGIPGIILAPVVIHYIKTESSNIPLPAEAVFKGG